MGWVEVLTMKEVRFGRGCWVSMGGVEEDEVVVARFGDVYVVGVALDDWFMVPEAALRRFLARLKLHDEAVQWLRGWALALSDEEVRRRAVGRARSTEYCR
jgi:hypothetical protein